MGKVKPATSVYMSEFGSKILSTGGFVLFCKVYELKINLKKKYNVS